MKPISLIIQAFGSYGARTTIDFTKPAQNIFLITGDTGSGKTTIFDAIVFALYGEASSDSNKKDGLELQSQYVDYSVEPYVELTFSELRGGVPKVYTVRRVPRHYVKMVRKDAYTAKTSQVSLIMPDGSQYPQKETDKKIEEIVGLTKSQFMQVAMIAQGEFMEVLRAKSDDKKQIFRKLFKTDFYQKIVDEIYRRKKEKEQEMGQIRTLCQSDVSRSVGTEEFDKLERFQELKEQIIHAESLNQDRLKEYVCVLSELCHVLEACRNTTKEEVQKAEKERDKHRDAFNNGNALLKYFTRYDASKRILEECEEELPTILEKTELIGKISLSYDLKAVYDRYMDNDGQVQQIQKNLSERQQELPGLVEKCVHDEEIEARVALNKAGANEAYGKLKESVEKAIQGFAEIQEATELLEKKQKCCSEAKEQENGARNSLQDILDKENEWKTLAVQLEGTEVRLAGWNAGNNEAQRIFREIESAKDVQKEIYSLQKQAKKLGQDKDGSFSVYQEKMEEYHKKQSIFFESQAGILAKEKLQEGKPCPVCGSLAHPSPCRLEIHENITSEMISALQEEEAKLHEDYNKKMQTWQNCLTRIGEKEEQFQNAFDKILAGICGQKPDFEGKTLEEAEKYVLEWKKDLEEQGAILREQEETRKTTREHLEKVDELKKNGQEMLDAAVQAYAAAEKELAAARAKWNLLQEQKIYDSEESARKILNEGKVKKDLADQEYEAALQASKASRTIKETTESFIKNYMEELPGAMESLAKRKEEYEILLMKSRITQDEWMGVTKLHKKEEIGQLQDAIDEYNMKKTAAKTEFENVSGEIFGKERPDLAQLEAQSGEAEERLKEVRRKLDDFTNKFSVDQQILDTLSKRIADRGEVLEEHGRLDGLYRLLSGKVTGARMDVETFVQRYYLEQILYAANDRLLEMSAGQFELRICDLEKAGEGKNRGLDLMVYSNVTGKEREVRTLSGGESFMAALSLALGMADQISEQSAAMNLDMMFIDEGFGSLDDHSRNQAVNVLKQMAGTSRLIGIISHVSELKQEIDDQLIVWKDETGSHVNWQIH